MLKKTPGKTTNYPYHKPEENHPPGKDSTKKISNLIAKAANIAGSAKSKKVIHTKELCAIKLVLTYFIKFILLIVYECTFLSACAVIAQHDSFWREFRWFVYYFVVK